MRYAQFYQMSTGYVSGSVPPRFDDPHKQPIEACGDRGVIVIDARLSPTNTATIAAAECVKRGFCGYRVFEGRSFSDSRPVSGYWPVANKVDHTATLAAYGN